MLEIIVGLMRRLGHLPRVLCAAEIDWPTSFAHSKRDARFDADRPEVLRDLKL